MDYSSIIGLMLTVLTGLLGIVYHHKQFSWSKWEQLSLQGLMVLMVIAIITFVQGSLF
ncbi:MAG: hypothetical protein ACRC17_00015 [Culicoidibacterales bacterium]